MAPSRRECYRRLMGPPYGHAAEKKPAEIFKKNAYRSVCSRMRKGEKNIHERVKNEFMNVEPERRKLTAKVAVFE